MLIEPLTREHDRQGFACGDDQVTRFFQEKALQDQERDLSRTMVLVDEGVSPCVIAGYHTLLLTQAREEEIPRDRPRIKRDLPVFL